MREKIETIAAVLSVIAFGLMAGVVGDGEFYGRYETADFIRLIVAGVLLIPALCLCIEAKINENKNNHE